MASGDRTRPAVWHSDGAEDPGLTAVAVLSLAIGVGANCAIFSVVDGIVLRVLPVRDPESLAIVQALTRQGNRTSLSHSDYEWLNQHNHVFSGLAASSARQLRRSLDGRTERIQASLVSGNYFTVLGVEPFLGRVIGPGDDGNPANSLVAVISYSVLEPGLCGDPGALGKRLRFGDTTLEVIGIAPNGFTGENVSSPRPCGSPCRSSRGSIRATLFFTPATSAGCRRWVASDLG